MGQNQRSLKNLFINPQFQLRVIIWISMIGLLLILALSFIFYNFIGESMNLILTLDGIPLETVDMIEAKLVSVRIMLISISFFFIFACCTYGVYLSHRIAGPLHKMKLTFNQIKDGNKDLRVQFRPRDEFHDLAESFNEMMDSIN